MFHHVDPPQPGCPVCDGNDNINCPHCLPWDDQDHLEDWRQRVDAGQIETAIGDDLHALQPGFWELTARAVNHG